MAKEGNESFNAATGVYEALLAARVVDPAEVARSTLKNAASIAALLLTTEALVVGHPEEQGALAGGHESMAVPQAWTSRVRQTT